MAAVQYATAAELKEWIDDRTGRVTDADGNSRDTMLDAILQAESRVVEKVCGRVFYASSDEARTYYPTPERTVWVVDLTSSSPTIVIDNDGDETPETTLTSADYVLLPTTEQGLAPLRYQMIRSKLGSSYTFYPGRPVQITGNWGYVEEAATPPAIKQAVLLRAARHFTRRKAKLGRVVIPETTVGETLAREDPDYMAMVEPYMHPLVKPAMMFA